MKKSQENYGLVSIIVHWIVALVVFGLFALGFWMVDLTYYDSWYKTAPSLHKSIGLSLFALMIFRVFWRVTHAKVSPLNNHKHWERKASHATHILLYVLLFVIMCSGYLISTADGRGIAFFDLFDVPGFGSLVEDQEDKAGLIHQYVGYFMMCVVLIHIVAALKHHIIDKDKTLLRMLGNNKNRV